MTHYILLHAMEGAATDTPSYTFEKGNENWVLMA